VSPRGLRPGKVNSLSNNSCVSLGAASLGRRRAFVLFLVSFRGGYSPPGLPNETVWSAFPRTKWGWLGVLARLVKQPGRKAAQYSSGRWRCANPPQREPSWSSSPFCLELRAVARSARIGCVRPVRRPMGGGIETPLVSRCLVSGGIGLPPPKADLLLTSATRVPETRVRVPVGSRLRSSPFPRATIRLGLAPWRELHLVVLTSRRPLRVPALISKEENRST